ncbi:MAG: RnfABCDGE type electron transport complex subunit D [Gammaproteobacteria bacterium]|nr:RnfABCDGE type electron transport complex subunit D [Gammaproteobacteria bacterium]
MNEAAGISSPHLHLITSVSRVMRQVIYALIPGIILSIWIFGWGILIHCLLTVIFALSLEALMLHLRKRSLQMFLYDGSAVVTGLLFALTISPFAPWWIDLAGICFAIVVAKHIYGGLGYNMFNPAMAGYIFVLICFPVELTVWPLAKGIADVNVGFIDTLSIIFAGQSSVTGIDGFSGATSLDYMKSQLSGMAMVSEIRTSPLFGSLGGKGSEWIAFAWLAGGVWLLLQGVIKWHMPVTFIASFFIISLLFYWYDASIYLSPVFNLFAGGTMLAAFFIVTDPVTSSTTPKGQLIFAAGIGVITYMIRSWGSYPDGIAFAVLIMNAAVPLIDSYTRPKVYGEQ